VDDDRDTLALIARELNVIGDVISADCAEKARRVLATDRIDPAVVDTHLGMVSGWTLPDIRDRPGNIIPVIIFSSSSPEFSNDDQMHSALSTMTFPLEFLKSGVRDRLRLSPTYTKRRSHDSNSHSSCR
jgi:DNA-binding NtrC family response regulator